MIAHMDQLTVVGRRAVAQDLVTALQNLGVVQVDPIEPGEALELEKFTLSDEDAASKEDWDALVAKSEALLGTLDAEARNVSRAEAPGRAQRDDDAARVNR